MGFYIAISLGLEACREHKTEPLQLGISSFPSHFVFLSSLLSMTTLQTIRDVSRRKRKGMIDISFFFSYLHITLSTPHLRCYIIITRQSSSCMTREQIGDIALCTTMNLMKRGGQ